jgi:hypothetical protein
MVRRPLVLTLSLLLTLALLSGAPAASAEDFADDCYDGPAAAASALQPHMWSSAGPANPWAVHGDALDLRAGWIGVAEPAEGEEAIDDVEEGVTAFTANIQVTAMPYHPANSRFNFSYTGPLGQHFVSAQANELGWAFTYGHLDTSETPQRQVTDGTTTGTVDEAAGIITIDLPEDAVPAPSEDGSAVTMPLLEMSSHTLIGTSLSGGLLLRVDASDWVCTAVLYEAQEEEAGTEASG